MKYCRKCIIPDTRPNVFILSDGVCTACNSFDLKKKFNWKKKNIFSKKSLEILKIKNAYMIV